MGYVTTVSMYLCRDFDNLSSFTESVPRILSPPVPLDEEAASKEKREPRYWVVPGSSVTYACPFMYPRHDRCVRISLDMGCQDGFSTTVYTGDLTHEYVSLNSEYRT